LAGAVKESLLTELRGEEMRLQARIMIVFLVILFVKSSAPAVLKTGDKFYAFSLKSIEDKVITVKLEKGQLTITSEFMENGRNVTKTSYPDAVLLDFWATWCVPCRAAMPYIQSIYEKFKEKEGQDKGGLELFGIAIDIEGSKVVKPFFKKFKITYSMLADPATGSEQGLIRTAKDMKSLYKVQEIPVVYLIDSKGVIAHVHVGFKKEKITELENTIGEMIKGERK
jgi:thiol-disulfide isomerase/thioredoxin